MSTSSTRVAPVQPTLPTARYYVISEHRGLVSTTDDAERAEELAIVSAVNTGRTVHLHDRMTELNGATK